MKRIFLICLFWIAYLCSNAQTDSFPTKTPQGSPRTIIDNNGGFRSHLINYTFTDTTQANLVSYFNTYNGAQIMTIQDSVQFWLRYNNKWNKVSGGSGGGSMVYPSAGIPLSTGSAWGTSYGTTGTGLVALNTSPSLSSPIIDGANPYISFRNGSGVAVAAARLWYDSLTGSWNVGMGNGNITQQIGEELFVYGKASSTINDAVLQIVKVSGTVGSSGVITFAPTTSGITDGDDIIGISTEAIATNGFGRVTAFGIVHGITTNGTAYGETWNDGDVIWYNPTTGNPTNIKPVAPNIKVSVGRIIKAGAGGSGSFSVEINHGSVLGGTDANVQITSPVDSNLLFYNGTYWVNKSIPNAGIVRVSDTSSMLANYRHWLAGYTKNSDTAAMLSPYINATDTIGMRTKVFGNYGNIQLNRFGVLATPASDSLLYSNTGLSVKNDISSVGRIGAGIAAGGFLDITSKIQAQGDIVLTDTLKGAKAFTGNDYSSFSYIYSPSFGTRGWLFGTPNVSHSAGTQRLMIGTGNNFSDTAVSYFINSKLGVNTTTVDSMFNLVGGMHTNRGVRHENLPSSPLSAADLMMVQDSITGIVSHRAIPTGGGSTDTTNYMIRLYNGWGINQTGTFPTKTILVDSFNVASRAYAKKVADSMATLKNIYNSDGTQSSADRVYNLGYTGDYRTLNFGKSDLSEKANIGLQNNSNNKNGYIVIQAYDSTNNTQTITQYFPQNGYKRDLITNISTSKSTDQKAYPDSLTIDFANSSKLKVKYTADSFVIRNLPRYNLSTDSVMTYNPTTGLVGYKTVTSGGGATPAGNYGNVQLNRFGSLATPASDSLDFDGGLAIKGTLSATALPTSAGVYNVRIDGSGNFSKQDTLADFTISNASHYLPDSLVVPVSTNALKIKNPKSGLYNTAATTDSSFTFNIDTSSSGLSGKYLRKTDTTGTYLKLIQGSNVTISGTYPNLTISASLSGGGGGNVFKDVATQNTFISNIDSAYATTATAAGTTTLTNASKYTQNFTGVTTQTVVLPDATTLVAGHSYYITNTSTGALTVNKNGGTLISTVAAGQTLSVTVTDISTSAGGWNYEYSGNSLTSSNFVFNETPSGTINGVNTTFALANTPTAGTVRIYLRGLRMKLTTDYTISGSTITMINIPDTGDDLIADYLK